MSIPTSNLVLEFYEDSGLTKRVYSIQDDKPTNVGTIKTFTLYVKNAIIDEIRNITFYAEDPDVTFNPKTVMVLAPNQSVKLDITWSPPKERRIALKTKIYAYCQVIIKP